MAKTQKNKATSFHLGQLKAKLAKLKRELLTPTTSGGGGGAGFDVARTGVASVGFIGFPSVGKSTLMSRITGQHSEAAAYEFTTLTTVPGQVIYNGAKIQMLDLPGIIQGAKDGKGRGRQVIAVAKTCHLIFIVLDVNKPLTDKKIIEAELEGFGIRVNKQPPNIVFKKKDKGGISITNTVPLSHIDHDEIKAVMGEYKISSADIAIRCDATIDDLIDVLEAKSRSYIPVIYALNKIDAISIEELDLLYRIPNACPISSEHGWNVDELMEQMLVFRVHSRPCIFNPLAIYSFGIAMVSCLWAAVGRAKTSETVKHSERTSSYLTRLCLILTWVTRWEKLTLVRVCLLRPTAIQRTVTD